MDGDTRLSALRQDFLATSTQSMPMAGMLFWAVAAAASRVLTPEQLAYFVGFGSGTVFPLGMLIDRLRGRRGLQGNRDNPVLTGFLQCLAIVAMLWPFVILAGIGRPGLVVLGGAILMGLVWVPYGWAADDPVGMRHAIARTLLCYAAYIFLPPALRSTSICLIVLACYFYSFLTMRKA
ncbi:MAG: putative rane protein [Alphaproteobacteria bacterium]|nr:putative rane protein [Alphaproteobacteria bacterium]